MEIQVPQEYTLKTPTIHFSQETFDIGVDDHPLGRQLPDLSGFRSVQALASDLRGFSGIPGVPRSTEEMIDRDAPLLSLHVTSFADATVVAVAWPHVLMDAMGLQALLRNWSLVLNGRAGEVLPLIGVHNDPMQEAVESDTRPKEELVVEKLAVGPLGIIILLFRLLWLKLWSPGFERRTVVLPQDTLHRLCQRARRDIDKEHDKSAFISEGDVLAAWSARMLAASQPKPSPVTVANFINVRFRMASLKERSGEYLQNMLQFVYASLPSKCDNAPLGRMALSYRRQLAEQSTEPQMLSYIRMQLDHVQAKGGLRLMFGDARAAMLTVNNLAKVDFFHNIDFSGAVAHKNEPATGTRMCEKTRQNPPGSIVFYQPLTLNEPTVVTSHLGILGKDHSGRVLITGIFQPNTWKMITEELEKL